MPGPFLLRKIRAYHTKEAVYRILDCFTGADGGAEFMFFRRMLEDMDAQAAKGDEAAGKLVESVIRFARLIGIAKKHYGPK